MSRAKVCLSIWFLLICCILSMSAQQAAPAAASAVVPPVIKFSGLLNDVNNKPMSGTVGVTFSLYKESQGGAALWVETQNVVLDKTGHYSVMLGSTKSQGVPSDVFANGEARWLGVQAQGEVEQPRTVLMSVPYALKAADAETIGGLPPSAFMKAPAPGSAPAGKVSPQAPVITGGGTTNQITKWLSPTKLGNSHIFEGAGGNVGVNTTAPSARFDVNGAARIRGAATVNGNLSAGNVGTNNLAASTVSATNVTAGAVSANTSVNAITGVMNGGGNNVAGVTGTASAAGDAGFTFGVWGTSASNQGRGVVGQGSGNSTVGVLGEVASGGTGIGVLGKALPGSAGQGVWGETFASSGSSGFGPDGVDGIGHSSQESGVFMATTPRATVLTANNQTGGFAGILPGGCGCRWHAFQSRWIFQDRSSA